MKVNIYWKNFMYIICFVYELYTAMNLIVNNISKNVYIIYVTLNVNKMYSHNTL